MESKAVFFVSLLGFSGRRCKNGDGGRWMVTLEWKMEGGMDESMKTQVCFFFEVRHGWI